MDLMRAYQRRSFGLGERNFDLRPEFRVEQKLVKWLHHEITTSTILACCSIERFLERTETSSIRHGLYYQRGYQHHDHGFAFRHTCPLPRESVGIVNCPGVDSPLHNESSILCKNSRKGILVLCWCMSFLSFPLDHSSQSDRLSQSRFEITTNKFNRIFKFSVFTSQEFTTQHSNHHNIIFLIPSRFLNLTSMKFTELISGVI